MSFLGLEVTNPFRSSEPKGYYDPIKKHTGADYLMDIGTCLYLSFPVKCIDVLRQREMGLTVYLENPKDGAILVFAHNSEVLVNVGEIIEPKQFFAKSGNTGSKSTNPHSHIEVIAKIPTPGLEFMTRTLGKVSGYNVDPEEYLMSQTHGSSEDLEWLKKHQIIFGEHKPIDPVTWGELAIVTRRLARKVLEWSRNKE